LELTPILFEGIPKVAYLVKKIARKKQQRSRTTEKKQALEAVLRTLEYRKKMSAAVYPASLFRKHSLVNLKSGDVLSTPAKVSRGSNSRAPPSPLAFPGAAELEDRLLVAPQAEYFLLYQPFNDRVASESTASDR
jgi:RNA polymerase-interacting CarD/CdnL/TRCF family regulator